MKKIPSQLLLLGVALSAFVAYMEARAVTPYREKWRPQFHFTPTTNWMNDPNGMVFYDGEYHLFYQFNPFGTKWGHMSWGHAISRDLYHWEHLPIALYEENDVMIFSGSAVVDWKNTSGLGKDGQPPLVAIYTGHYTKKPLQNQHIAYSNDRGRTWTKFTGNPVLDIGEKDFRDPKVFWHEPTARWMMVVAWPTHRKVRFYASPDLKQWTHLSDFGPAGSTKGIWECPDLFSLPVAGNAGQTKWTLIVNVGSGAPAGGSGCQYFVGDFDGTNFVNDATSAASSDVPSALWADFGRDFYAAVSWADVPKSDGRRLWLGWMSNWEYANDVPTEPWRSALSVPRELHLRSTRQGMRLIQQPVRELRELRSQPQRLGQASFSEAAAWLRSCKLFTDLIEVELEFRVGKDCEDFGLKIDTGPSEETVLRCEVSTGHLSLDRTRSGKTDFNDKFSGIHRAPLALRPAAGPVLNFRLVTLRVLLDRSSIEVFAQGGEVVMTDLILPTTMERSLHLFSDGPAPRVQAIRVWRLNSVWK